MSVTRASNQSAVLGRGLRIRGHVRGTGDLVVEAQVQGDVLVSGALELSAGANVIGAIKASTLTVAGELRGNVDSAGPVLIAHGADVEGDIRASELSLDEGARFVGRIDADFDLPDAIS